MRVTSVSCCWLASYVIYENNLDLLSQREALQAIAYGGMIMSPIDLNIIKTDL